MTNLTSSLRRTPRLLLVVLAVAAVLVVSGSVPAVATEATSEAPASTEAPAEEGAAEGGAAEADEGGKLTISSNPHDQFGLILFGLMGLAGLAMGVNAIRQLKGQRPAADGRIRWR